MVLGRLASLALVSTALFAGSAHAQDAVSLALAGSRAPIQKPAFPTLRPLPGPVRIASTVANDTQAKAVTGIGNVTTVANGLGAVAITTITAINTNVVTNVSPVTNIVIGLGK